MISFCSAGCVFCTLCPHCKLSATHEVYFKICITFHRQSLSNELLKMCIRDRNNVLRTALNYRDVYKRQEQCPIRPVFTIAPGGRTANIIWEYVSTMVVAKYLPHRQLPYTQHYILERIINIFENTTNTLPIVEQIPRHCEHGPGEPGFTNWTGRNTPEIILYTSYKTEELVEMYARYKGNIIVNMYALYLEPVYRAYMLTIMFPRCV